MVVVFQVQKLSAYSEKLDKRIKALKSQRSRTKSLNPVLRSSKKFLRQTVLPFSKQPVEPVAEKTQAAGFSGNMFGKCQHVVGVNPTPNDAQV